MIGSVCIDGPSLRARKLGCPGSYEDEEGFYLDAARRAGLDGWTVDRLLYNFRDEARAAPKSR